MNAKRKNSEPSRMSRLLKWLFDDNQRWVEVLLLFILFAVVTVATGLISFGVLGVPTSDERLVIYQDRYDACIAQNIEPESCHDIALRQAGIAK